MKALFEVITMSNQVRPFVGAYWKERPATHQQCVSRLHEFMIGLGERDEKLAKWVQQGWSVRQALSRPIDLSIESLTRQLKQHRDFHRRIMPDIGFSFAAWNGNMEASASLSVSVGSYSEHVGNSVALCCPPVLQELWESGRRYKSLLEFTIECWDPDIAVARDESQAAQYGVGPLEWNSWYTYERGKGITDRTSTGDGG